MEVISAQVKGVVITRQTVREEKLRAFETGDAEGI